MSREIIQEQRRLLKPDSDGSRSLIAMNIDSMLELPTADDFRFSVEEGEGYFNILIEALCEDTCINFASETFEHLPYLANLLAQRGDVKVAFEAFRLEKLNQIEAARKELSIWVTGL